MIDFIGIIKNLYNRYFKYFVFSVILGIGILLAVKMCTRKRDIKEIGNEAIINHEITRDKSELVAIQDREEKLKERIKQDSLKHLASQNAFKKEIKSLKVKLAYARTRVIPLIDSIPELDRFVDLQDSTITLQDNRIDTLEYEKAEQWAKFNALISASEEKNRVQVELVKHFEDLNKQLTKQVKREKRNKVVWKVVAFGLIGGLVYQSVNN